MSQTKAQLIAGTSSQDVTFDDATVNSLNGGPLSGARNRIINGDMRIAQRGTGAFNNSSAANTYTVDRFLIYGNQDNKFSAQQNTADAPTTQGFSHCLKITSLSAYTVGAAETFTIQHKVEGFNSADLAFGSASAKSVTLSFWARSSLTGSFGGAISNSAANRTYPFSYTISATDTWEYKTIVIPGDTSGTWLTDNSVGINVIWSLGAGSTFSGTAGSWSGSTFVSTTGATSVVGTSGATFYITGVQLEAGSVATPFERRSYGQELALCQRYYERLSNSYYGTGYASITNQPECVLRFIVTKRAAPTCSSSGTFLFPTSTSSLAFDGSDVQTVLAYKNGVTVIANTAFRCSNSASSYIEISAEL